MGKLWSKRQVRAFIHGFGSVAVLFPPPVSPQIAWRYLPGIHASDADRLHRDWLAVGDDMKASTDKAVVEAMNAEP